jgi:RecA-family ATPase
MEFKELFGNFSQPGKVVFISVRPKRMEPVKSVEKVLALKDRGLEGPV